MIVDYPQGSFLTNVLVRVRWHDTRAGKLTCSFQNGSSTKHVTINSAKMLLYNRSENVTNNVKVGKQSIGITVSPQIPIADFVYYWEVPKPWKIDPFSIATQHTNTIWIITDESSDAVIKVYAKNSCNSQTDVLSIPIKRKQ